MTLNSLRLPRVCKRMFSLLRPAMALCCAASFTFGASWSAITKPNSAPSSLGTMILLTDGRVMILSGDNNQDWIALEPDSKGDYVNGSFKKLSSMSIGRLYFASQVLPNGEVWLLGGEYTGPYGSRNDTNSGEIYDPVADMWSPITPYPNISNCGTETVVSDGKLQSGSPSVKDIFSTFGMQTGWTVTGSGIPAGATIASIVSSTEVTLSANRDFDGNDDGNQLQRKCSQLLRRNTIDPLERWNDDPRRQYC